MKIFLTSQIKELDSYTIANEPIDSIDLMERAAQRLYDLLVSQFPEGDLFYFFIGPGNNGGDGLAVARLLSGLGRKLEVFLLSHPDGLSPDAKINYQRLSMASGPHIQILENGCALPAIPKDAIVIDAIFGCGLTRPVNGFIREVIRHINSTAQIVVAIDTPSGLPGEDCGCVPSDSIVRASYTYTLEFPKISFFFPENLPFVGEWTIVPIGLHKQGIESIYSNYTYLLKDDIAKLLPKRSTFGHKGTFGHLLAIAGRKGMMGASMLVAKGAYRAGLGLVTCHVPEGQGHILQIGVPEVLVEEDLNPLNFSTTPALEKYAAVVVGPGIGQNAQSVVALEQLFYSLTVPVVIDADAINIMSIHTEIQKVIPNNAILTPHPKELERLVGTWSNSYERLQRQKAYAVNHGVVLLCKGAYTTIALPSGEIFFNSNGNSGMATGGSGDALSGIIGGLLAQGVAPASAAKIGVFIHGLAGDIAASKHSEMGVMASDIINEVGNAWLQLIA